MSFSLRWARFFLTFAITVNTVFGLSHPHAHSTNSLDARHNKGYRSVAYYVDWAIYARQHYPVDLPADKLTHVLFSFAKINATTGKVELADPWADSQIVLNITDPKLDPKANNVHGILEQLYLLKKQNRHLKVLLSIGGYSYSQGLNGTFTDEHIQMFTTSAVDLVKTYGFDGLDIDYEFPADEKDASDFVKLLKSLRRGLDKSTAKYAPGAHFEISAAVSAGPSHYKLMPVKQMDKYLDFWNLMAYDYAGPWDANDTKTSGHQSNIYPSKDKLATKFNTVDALNYYMKDVKPSKMVLLMPLYGHSFEKTTGPGKPFDGVGAVNESMKSWEAGSWDLSVLPKAGATEYYDSKLIASWSLDNSTGEMMSYDSDKAAVAKVKFAKKMKLGGVGFWESSGDRKGEGSRISLVVETLGGKNALNCNKNWLEYTESPYANLRNGKEYTGSTPMVRSVARRHRHVRRSGQILSS